jgi:hypothetical protein
VACGLAGWRLGGPAGLERRKGKGRKGFGFSSSFLKNFFKLLKFKLFSNLNTTNLFQKFSRHFKNF